MKNRTRRICSVAMLAMLACTMAPALPAETPPCPVGTDVLAEYRLFFGRSQGTVEVVTDEAWQAFLATEITPRFPDGLTVLDAAGQWRDATGTIVRGTFEARDHPRRTRCLGDAAYRGDCPRIQAHLRPGIRSACDHDRLRIVLTATFPQIAATAAGQLRCHWLAAPSTGHGFRGGAPDNAEFDRGSPRKRRRRAPPSSLASPPSSHDRAPASAICAIRRVRSTWPSLWP